ncbi:hypothetical protein LX32DRAFT_348028 [Colletotrichum zoysiae]|uniref:Uncharacterized protein n=1 Tax=Colletotrichum zoysiae TaxID=1216348 RepID=A0AAD9HIN0_9PEZI|nr:hypothetical protein LX32DRAFT_348028 [Colletotrichum zoysiae]
MSLASPAGLVSADSGGYSTLVMKEVNEAMCGTRDGRHRSRKLGVPPSQRPRETSRADGRCQIRPSSDGWLSVCILGRLAVGRRLVKCEVKRRRRGCYTTANYLGRDTSQPGYLPYLLGCCSEAKQSVGSVTDMWKPKLFRFERLFRAMVDYLGTVGAPCLSDLMGRAREMSSIQIQESFAMPQSRPCRLQTVRACACAVTW